MITSKDVGISHTASTALLLRIVTAASYNENADRVEISHDLLQNDHGTNCKGQYPFWNYQLRRGTGVIFSFPCRDLSAASWKCVLCNALPYLPSPGRCSFINNSVILFLFIYVTLKNNGSVFVFAPTGDSVWDYYDNGALSCFQFGSSP